MLKPFYQDLSPEAGCDEAGRGCMAGAVFAAAVILPQDFCDPILNDSKKLSALKRKDLRTRIESHAISWAVAQVDVEEIDQINILNASIKAMHLALEKLTTKPAFIVVDGNRFKPFKKIPHQTIIKGDGTYASIAAASILAKTYRDEYMEEQHRHFPHYNWIKNKGYGTLDHRQAMHQFGRCILHRKSFKLKPTQLDLEL
ncbi:MAG: hypothetical protein RL131_965 [Bacteroidota bacterium]